MSDLVLGLLVLGAVLFAGVLLYNRVQERAAQRAFAAKHPDALLDEPAPRREPVLHKPGVAHAAPHPGVDYTIDITLAQPTPEILEGWAAVANRFGRRAMLVPGRDERTWRATSWLPTATAATADTAATTHKAVTWKSTARRVPSLTIWLVSWNTSSPPGSERTAAIVSVTST